VPLSRQELRSGESTGIPTVITELATRSWTARAACLESDRRFVLEPGSERQSPGTIVGCLLVCSGCPVRRQCLDDALGEEHIEVIGVWGGTTTMERRHARTLIAAQGRTNEAWVLRSKADYEVVIELLLETFDARLEQWHQAAEVARQSQQDPSAAPRYSKQEPLPA